MALSAAMQWALANGMSQADVYKNINDFLATNPTAAQTQAQMAQYGISPEDVAAATGGASGGLLSGNIMAGASWNSLNTALPSQLTQATGQQTSNYAVGGATTADTLKQLNTFLAGGGAFDPNATVFLQTGGVDFLQGVDKTTIKDNINQIVKTLGDQGVNVVLTGSPYAASINDVVTNNFNPEVDPLFKEIAKENKNVALVGTQGEILQNKALLVDALHTNAEGTAIYNQSVIDALSQFKNDVPASTPQAIAQVQQTNTVATTPSVITQAASNPVVAQTLAATTNQNPLVKLYQDTLGRTPTQAEIDSWGFGNTIEPYELDRFLGAARNEATSTMPTTGTAANLAKQILAQGTSSQWTGQGYGSAEKNAYDMGVMLAGQGITDINQLGQATKVIPASEQQVEGGDGFTTVATPERTVSTFVNKATGQEISPYYDKAASISPNIWGGTFTGKDSTAYGVQFDAAGKPIFYSQYGGDSSDLASYAPLIKMALMAATAGGAGGALGSSLGLTGAAAQGVGTGLLSAGANALSGGTGSDILKAGLIGGVGAYGGSLFSNMDTPVDFTNMTADQIDEALQSNLIKDLKNAGVTNPSEFLTGQGGNAATYIQESVAATDLANNLANQGLNSSEIAQLLESVGVTPTAIADALDSLPVTSSTGGMLSSVATTPATDAVNVTGQAPTTVPTAVIPSTVTTPTTSAGTVNVTGTTQPAMTTQEAVNLVNSQLAANVSTPTNLANVTVTGTADKGLMSNADVTNAILSTLAGVSTPTTVTTPTSVTTPTQTITDQKLVDTTNQNITKAVTSLLPTTVTTPTQTITNQKPATKQELVNAIAAVLPTVTPSQATTVAEQVIASGKNITTQDAIAALTTALPSITTPTTTAVTPTQTITNQKPAVSTQELVNTLTAAVPTVTTTPTTTPAITVTAPKTTPPPPTLSDVVAPIAAVLPAVTTTPTTTPAVTPTQTITAQKPSSINDVVTAATIPLIQPSTPLTTTPVTSTTDKNSLGLTDAQMFNLLKAGIGLFGSVGGAAALSGGGASGGGIGALPTQGVPLYSQDYFNQIQQNYNRILPAVPRDVSSPLRDWYLSQYGA